MHVDPDRTVAIVNPAAAGGAVGRGLAGIETAIRSRLGPVQIWPTERPGHAVELAAKARWEGAELLLSVGGDGTHSEVVAGLYRVEESAPGAVVGLLPMGVRGDFQRVLEEAASLQDYLALVVASEPREVDLGLVYYRDGLGEPRRQVFLNEASVGMSATVCARISEGGKRVGGPTYLLESLRALSSHHAPLVRVSMDGQVVAEVRANTVMACNGPFAGGGMHFAPGARIGDGLLEVVVIAHSTLLRTAMVSPALYSGALAEHALVSTFRGFEMQVEVLTDGDAAVEADGEPLGGGCPVRAQVVPRGIRLLGVREDAL